MQRGSKRTTVYTDTSVVRHLKADTIAQVRQDTAEHGTVLLSVWSDTCAPCALQSPVLDEFAAVHGDAIPVFKVCANDFPETVEQLGIDTVPTMLIMRGGAEQKRIVGLHSLEELEAKVLSFVSLDNG